MERFQHEMDLHELEVLGAIVEAGGFHRAAKQLAITQSAISQTVARLEKRIGTALLVRSTPPTPTPAGERVLEFAQRCFEEAQALELDLADIERQSTGRVRLGASQMGTNLDLGDLLTAFTRKHPRASFDVANMPSRELVLKVRDGSCEIGFGPFERQMEGFRCFPCYLQRLRLYASSAHPHYESIRRGDESALKEAVLITSYLDPLENRPNPRRLRFRFAGVWQIASLNLRVEMIARGLGLGYLPEVLVRSHAAGKKLRAIPRLEYGTVERQIGLYVAKTRKLSPMGQLFVEFADDHFQRRARRGRPRKS